MLLMSFAPIRYCLMIPVVHDRRGDHSRGCSCCLLRFDYLDRLFQRFGGEDQKLELLDLTLEDKIMLQRLLDSTNVMQHRRVVAIAHVAADVNLGSSLHTDHRA
jgi:hypothetical protein